MVIMVINIVIMVNNWCLIGFTWMKHHDEQNLSIYGDINGDISGLPEMIPPKWMIYNRESC